MKQRTRLLFIHDWKVEHVFEVERFQSKKTADSDLISVPKIFSLLNSKGLMKFEEIAPLLIKCFSFYICYFQV